MPTSGWLTNQWGLCREETEPRHSIWPVSLPNTPHQLGVAAHSCNPAAGKLELVDGLRSGALLLTTLCRSGVRTKLGVDMADSAEAKFSRSSNEGRTGPGRKRSRQKSPRSAVVG